MITFPIIPIEIDKARIARPINPKTCKGLKYKTVLSTKEKNVMYLERV